MSKIHESGPAFPIVANHEVYGLGMSLRDWFAGQALAGLCANSIPGSHHRPDRRAAEAYEQADAMLSERERSSSPAVDPLPLNLTAAVFDHNFTEPCDALLAAREAGDAS